MSASSLERGGVGRARLDRGLERAQAGWGGSLRWAAPGALDSCSANASAGQDTPQAYDTHSRLAVACRHQSLCAGPAPHRLPAPLSLRSARLPLSSPFSSPRTLGQGVPSLRGLTRFYLRQNHALYPTSEGLSTLACGAQCYGTNFRCKLALMRPHLCNDQVRYLP